MAEVLAPEDWLRNEAEALAFLFAGATSEIWSRGSLAARAGEVAHENTALFEEARATGRPIALVARPEPNEVTLLVALLTTRTPAVLLHPSETKARIVESVVETGAVGLFDRTLKRTSRDVAPELPPLPPNVAVALGTSGTTGRPKWVLHSFESLLASVRLHRSNLPWKPGDRWLLTLPFSHVGGLGILVRGLTDAKGTVLSPGLRAGDSNFVPTIEATSTTLLSLVPTQVAKLVEAATRCPSVVRAAFIGGAALPASLREKAESLGYPVLTTYGLTEFGSQVVTERPGARSTGVGFLLPENELEIRESGRIALRGPSCMLGYWGQGSGLDERGYFLTSDYGGFETDGSVSVRGRIDHVIITGGENVAPELVEAAALTASGVSEALAFGEPDPTWGQRIVLRVAAKPEASIVEGVLLEELKGLLPTFAVPKRIELVEALEKTPSGKIARPRVGS